MAVITGASRGIGRAVAIALAGEGYDIAAIARSVNSEGMENLGPEVEKRGAQFFPIGLDISCTLCQKEVVSNILERYGRIDFLVNNAGVVREPRDIDEVYFEHPKVEEASTIGLPHPTRGESIKVFIVLKQGQTATEQEMIDYAATKLAKYKLPTEVEFCKELPKTTVGKVLRKELRAKEMEKRGLAK